ncbi:Putative membrane protein (fragment) [Carnobacterium maltaromaticum]
MKKEKVKLLVQGIILLILGVLFMMNPVRQGVLFLLILGSVFCFFQEL